ncbi:MAG: hypothetical protein KJ904_06495 [Alphaproteobacteria bacterium]|nr:hypothetical protein [Alphaproteobacteria bacterium]MBU0796987.1 hypothetical protein [Alphaproteobacteria bacterium]MBU0886796.1 hypothetical protein [Alphaproteobacteria bacterium]MBU1812462.1 hypothetical protein [Alphaproteobacteria bacterium]
MAEAGPRLVPLAFALGLANLSHIAIAATDLVMIGWLGPAELAAASLASHLFYLPLFCLLGFVGGAGAPLARLLGAGDLAGARGTVTALAAVAGVLLLPILALSVAGEALLLSVGQEPGLAQAAGPYLAWLAWASPCIAVFAALWTIAAVRGHAAAVSRISLLAIPVNAAGNALFMFGLLGLPELGLVGAGVATFLTVLLKMLALLFWLYRRGALAGLLGGWSLAGLRRNLTEVLSYGAPMAVLEGATMGFFAAIAMMTGLLGAAALAANAIALQAAEVGIAFLFGIGEAATIVIAFHRGQENIAHYRQAIRQTLVAALAVSALYGGFLALARGPLVALVLEPGAPFAAETAALAQLVLLFAAASLPLDCGRIALVGILRGLGDARWPAGIAILGLWSVGIPVAAWLSLGQGQGLAGIWTGMLMAMSLVSATLFQRLRRVLNQERMVP